MRNACAFLELLCKKSKNYTQKPPVIVTCNQIKFLPASDSEDYHLDNLKQNKKQTFIKD